MKLIICFGHARSGTTWAFNVTSQLIDATTYSYHKCFVNKKGKGLESAKKDIKNKDFLIIKIHNIKILQLIIDNLSYRSKSCFFILSLRDPLQTILSEMRIINMNQENFKPTQEQVQSKLQEYNSYFQKIKTEIIPFFNPLIIDEQLIDNHFSSSVVQLINKYVFNSEIPSYLSSEISQKFSKQSIKNFLKDTFGYSKKSFEQYDPVSHFHVGHIKDDDYLFKEDELNSKELLSCLRMSQKNLILDSCFAKINESNFSENQILNLLDKVNIFIE